MNEYLKQAKQDIRAFIREHWSDEKLAGALAFNQDGCMNYVNTCSCLMGVTLSDYFHHDRVNCIIGHYHVATRLAGAYAAEKGYMLLGSMAIPPFLCEVMVTDELRRRRLAPILKAELHRRDRLAKMERLLAQCGRATRGAEVLVD